MVRRGLSSASITQRIRSSNLRGTLPQSRLTSSACTGIQPCPSMPGRAHPHARHAAQRQGRSRVGVPHVPPSAPREVSLQLREARLARHARRGGVRGLPLSLQRRGRRGRGVHARERPQGLGQLRAAALDFPGASICGVPSEVSRAFLRAGTRRMACRSKIRGSASCAPRRPPMGSTGCRAISWNTSASSSPTSGCSSGRASCAPVRSGRRAAPAGGGRPPGASPRPAATTPWSTSVPGCRGWPRFRAGGGRAPRPRHRAAGRRTALQGVGGAAGDRRRQRRGRLRAVHGCAGGGRGRCGEVAAEGGGVIVRARAGG